MVDPLSLAEELCEANERLIRTALPGVEDLSEFEEVDVVPLLVTTANRLCAAGDVNVCHMMRSWLWDGIVTMLIDADVKIGGPNHEQAYAAFVCGEEALTVQIQR